MIESIEHDVPGHGAGGTTRAARMIACAGFLLALSACTVIPRLDMRLDADPLGVPPSTPMPTPPEDQANWRTGSVAATVVADPGGGRLVRVAPLPAFAAAPDNRQVFLIAVTERFTTNPPANIRGSIRLRLVGLGTVGFALRPLQAEQTLDFIGGFELSNFLPPAGGSITLFQGFRADRLGDPFGIPSSGLIAGYTMGQVVDINWTIDQASRTFAATLPGNPTQSVTFPVSSGATANTPIQRLEVYLWMHKPTSDTVLFVDNVRAEEYR